MRESGTQGLPPTPVTHESRHVVAPDARRTAPVGRAVCFVPQVVLSKDEAFGACQALADAGRGLVRSGGSVEADSLCSLFVLLEERLVSG